MRIAVIVTLALLVPGAASSQAPPLLATWTTCGPYGLGRPSHLARDAAGNLYVADMAERRVFVFSPAGGYVTSWTCPALAPLDFSPFGIAVSNDGRVYVSTPYPNGPAPFWVTAYTTSGAYLGPFATMGSDPGQTGQVFGVATDAAGNVYMMDWTHFRVDVLSGGGGFVAQWGSYGSGPGQFSGPIAIAVGPDGLVYSTDDIDQRIQVFTTSGAFVRQWGTYGSGPGQIAGPWGIALDASGRVYLADAANDRIEVFTSIGQYVAQWGTPGSGPGQLNQPRGVGVSPDGRIFVADTWNARIQVFGELPTPAKSASWGSIKARYR